MYGGEIFVPKIPSYKIMDIALAINPKAKINFIGIRPGEKIHEEMISLVEGNNTVDLGKVYAILPSFIINGLKSYLKKNNGKRVREKFSFVSNKNGKFLSVNQIKKLISKL